MHPVMLQQLAAERVREMTADVDDARRARLARRARRAQTPVHTTRPDLPRMHAELQSASPTTAVAARRPPTGPALLLTAIRPA
jgi:hypothetical protein